MVDQARARKLADRIAQIVAEMLEWRIKDPRLGFVTVTEARLTGDLREATVFYTVYGSAEERAASAAGLASATGVIRSEVGRQTGLKHTPSITFVAGHPAGRGAGRWRTWWPRRARRTPGWPPCARARCPPVTRTRTGNRRGRGRGRLTLSDLLGGTVPPVITARDTQPRD